MPKLVLVRHGQSERNIVKKRNHFYLDDESRKAVKGIPDHLIALTEEGRRQAITSDDVNATRLITGVPSTRMPGILLMPSTIACVASRIWRAQCSYPSSPRLFMVAQAAAAVMRTEGTPLDDHRASAAYRSATLGTALLKLFADNATPQEVGA